MRMRHLGCTNAIGIIGNNSSSTKELHCLEFVCSVELRREDEAFGLYQRNRYYRQQYEQHPGVTLSQICLFCGVKE